MNGTFAQYEDYEGAMLTDNSTMANDEKLMPELDCPVYHETSEDWIDFFHFWIGGVFQTCLAVPGFVGKTDTSPLFFTEFFLP